MASFVESATLRINDQSSAKLNKLTASLRAMQKAAQSLQRSTGKAFNVRTNTTQIGRAVRDLNRLNATLKNTGKSQISPRINMTGVSRLSSRLQRLQQQINRINGQSVGPSSRGGGLLSNQGGGARGGRGRGRGGLGGMGIGASIGGGIGIIGGFGAVTTASILAARALKKVAEAGQSRDRTDLLLSGGASPSQRAIIDRAREPEGQGPIKFTSDERKKFAQSLLGDVGGTEKQKATAAVNITEQLEKDVLPRLFAMNPDKSRLDIQSGLRNMVKSINLATSEIVDPKSGRLTGDATRVLRAQQIAMAADPDLTPELMRTVSASLKTSAFSLSEEQLARVFINAGSRGQRAGNETFMAQNAFTGTVDVKKLNNALDDLGLLIGAQRNKQGNVIAGSGVAVDELMLMQDPSTWFMKHVAAPMEKALEAVTPQIPVTNAERVAELNRRFPGLRQTAKQGLADIVLGDEQARAATQQGRTALEQPITAALGESWTAQMNNVAVALTDGAATFASAAAKQIGAAQALEDAAKVFRGGMGVLEFAKENPLVTTGLIGAGVALTGSAAALTRSAILLAGAGISKGAGVASGAGVAGAAASGRGGLISKAVGFAALAWAAYEGGKTLVNPQSDLAKENRIGGFGVDDLIRKLLVSDKPIKGAGSPEFSRAPYEIIGRDAQSRVQAIDAETRAAGLYDEQQAERLKTALDQGSTAGAEKLQVGLTTGATTAGGALAQPLIDAASVIGAQIAAAMSANFRPAPLTVGPISLPTAAPANTGANINGVR